MAVRRHLPAQVVERPVGGARQAGIDGAGEPLARSVIHRREAPPRLRNDRFIETAGGAGPGEDVDVEGGEIGEVEAHGGAAVGRRQADRCVSSRAPA